MTNLPLTWELCPYFFLKNICISSRVSSHLLFSCYHLPVCGCARCLRCDITAVLLYVEHLMWSVCESPEALVHSSPYSAIALIAGGSDWPYQIHSLCEQLLTVLVIVTAPLSLLYRLVCTVTLESCAPNDDWIHKCVFSFRALYKGDAKSFISICPVAKHFHAASGIPSLTTVLKETSVKKCQDTLKCKTRFILSYWIFCMCKSFLDTLNTVTNLVSSQCEVCTVCTKVRNTTGNIQWGGHAWNDCKLFYFIWLYFMQQLYGFYSVGILFFYILSPV